MARVQRLRGLGVARWAACSIIRRRLGRSGRRNRWSAMSQLVYTCPHCQAEKITFDSAGVRKKDNRDFIWHTLFICRKCREPIAVTFWDPEHGNDAPDPVNFDGDPQEYGFHIVAVYPAPEPPSAPPHVPQDIANDYMEAVEGLRRRAFSSAGLMFRRTLEKALKQLAPDKNRQTPYRIIQEMAKEKTITQELAKLAHCIRDDGNVFAHEGRLDEGLANEMKTFTHLFLMYTFSLPAMVAEARAALSDSSSSWIGLAEGQIGSRASIGFFILHATTGPCRPWRWRRQRL